jgi:Flp pilus assembly protein TadG
MTVELAVFMPVLLAMVAILVNAMSYLEVCARFDRVAAEAVRIQATSPAYGEYDLQLRAGKVKDTISAAFSEYSHTAITVTGTAGSGSAAPGNTSQKSGGLFAMLTRTETFRCTLKYQPLGFAGTFFGVRFFELEHSNFYTIDPFRPGAVV